MHHRVMSVAITARKNVFLLTCLFVCLIQLVSARSQGQVILVTAESPNNQMASSEQYQYQQQPYGQRSSPRASQFEIGGSKSTGLPVQQQIYQDQTSVPTTNQQYQQSANSHRSSKTGGYGSSGYSSGGSNYGQGQSGYSGPIQAAVVTRHQIHYYDVPSQSEPIKPTTVEVGVSAVPINIILRSSSSSLNIQQVHDGAKGSYQETESTDEPHMLKHTVLKPIIQEVYELITPYRYIKQELQPVQEVIQTIVARSNGKTAAIPYGGTGASYQAADTQVPVVQEPVQQVDEYQQSPSPKVITQSTASVAQPQLESMYNDELEVSKPNDLEKQLIDQIGHDYMAASSNALLSSVYGAPAFTSPESTPKIRPQLQEAESQNQMSTIDSDLVNQYLPLVYEVMNSMEDNNTVDSPNHSSDKSA